MLNFCLFSQSIGKSFAEVCLPKNFRSSYFTEVFDVKFSVSFFVVELFCWAIQFSQLTHFQPVFHLYTPSKHQETGGFLMFSGGIEVKHWLKKG